ncbi:sulfurtransferase complex subunit TusC [Ferrimonas sediminicola]|uniref:Sulfurtransferase complex subunit TusC n=1 Tax=Ferrimonas sediminicola TaxID=2569538 RepID=A0A4U1BCD7_9GAMM|nr:sulfurtransferase complex subunit TusC [Ferrimonas sediminicola]TKB48535.1 sulfurtransferase complex subunit TusC [Ferrimonas sediminicola]
MKPLGILFTRAPHGTARGREALDLALLSASYDIPTRLFFSGDGVYQLLKAQQPDRIEARDYIATFKALPLYDVEEILVCGHSLNERGLCADDLLIEVAVAEPGQFALALNQTEQVLTF